MTTDAELRDDRDRREWLACLQAAATTIAALPLDSSAGAPGNRVVQLADFYLEQLHERAGAR